MKWTMNTAIYKHKEKLDCTHILQAAESLSVSTCAYVCVCVLCVCVCVLCVCVCVRSVKCHRHDNVYTRMCWLNGFYVNVLGDRQN